jgi:hypothetical protein
VSSPSAMQWEAVGVAVVAIWSLAGILLGLMRRLLAAGDEGWQAVNLTLGPGIRLGRADLLRLRGRRLLKCLGVARDIGLWLACAVRRFWQGTHGGLSVVITLVEALVAPSLHLVLVASEVRIVLPILLLRRRNHAIVVFGMLIIVFCCNRVAGRLCVARKLNVFFRYVGRIAANFHIRPVRLEYARHWIVTLAMVVPPAHPLVLTVSHDLPVANPFRSAACGCRLALPKVPVSSRERRDSIRVLAIQAGDKCAARFAALSASVSRSSNPRPPLIAALPSLPHHLSASREPVQNR